MDYQAAELGNEALSLPIDFWIEADLIADCKSAKKMRELAKVVRVFMSQGLDEMPKRWTKKRRVLSAQIEYMVAIEDALNVLCVKFGGIPF